MNKDLLEFWGNFMIQAARGQRRMEEFEEWARKGFEALEGQRAFWSAFRPPEKEAEREAGVWDVWEESMVEFRKSYREFVKIFGMVSMEEYQELLKRNEELEKKLAEQRKAHPRARSSGKGVLDVQREIEKGLQGLIEKQGEQFRELMDSIRKLYGPGLQDR